MTAAATNPISPLVATTCILLVFFSALSGALLPLHLLSAASTPPVFFRYGNSLAAGFLAAAAFVHLFPDGDRVLLAHFPHRSYPFAGALALSGSAVVFSLDHLIRHKLSQKPHHHHHHHHHHHQDHQDHQDHLPSSSSSSSSLPQLLEHRTIPLADVQKPPQEQTSLLPTTTTSSAHGHPHSTPSVPTPFVSYVLAAGLSVHSLVEGVTLGASVLKDARFLAVLAAIIAHKTFAAISLGTALARDVRHSPHPTPARNTASATAIAFAAITPLGAALGATAVTKWLDQNTGAIAAAALNCFSAGIFLYIAFVELLAEEFRFEHPDDSSKPGSDDVMQRAAVFLAAAAAMSLLAIWT